MKEYTFTFSGSEAQIFKLFDFLREKWIPCRITETQTKVLTITVQEISIEVAHAILDKY